MMDPRLLELYNRERLYMQALSGEFALGHPKIAGRLAMLAQETGDPYVNRLIQSSAFVNARMQMRFDDEFPLLTQALLSSVYPDYLSPTPSIAVARFHAGGKAAGFVSGHTIERGAELTSLNLPDGEKTACMFSTTHDVALFPLDLVDGRLTHVPPDIQRQDR